MVKVKLTCRLFNSALTLEHLESAFYKEGFTKFPASDFIALGLSQAQVDGLVQIAATEATHVTVLMAAIAGAGATPFEPCTYDFKFTDAASMVATAKVLEAVGVSAYVNHLYNPARTMNYFLPFSF